MPMCMFLYILKYFFTELFLPIQHGMHPDHLHSISFFKKILVVTIIKMVLRPSNGDPLAI